MYKASFTMEIYFIHIKQYMLMSDIYNTYTVHILKHICTFQYSRLNVPYS